MHGIKGVNLSNLTNIWLAIAILADLDAKEALREMIAIDYFTTRDIVLKKLAEIKDVAFLRGYLMKKAHLMTSNTVAGYLASLGDVEYLVKILQDPNTDEGIRKEVESALLNAEILQDPKIDENVRLNGAWALAENGYAKKAVIIETIWEIVKKDPAYIKEYSDAISSLLSNEGLDSLYAPGSQHSYIYSEMVETAPELLIDAVKKMADRKSTERSDDQTCFMMFIVALLFDKGKITEGEAKKIITKAGLSEKEALDMVQNEETEEKFNAYPVIQKLFGIAQ